MTTSDSPPEHGHLAGHSPDPTVASPNVQLHRFAVQRIPPTHDYIRQNGSVQDPGSAPVKPGAPIYGDIHKFGYTRPPKKHEQPADGGAPSVSPENPPFIHLHVHSNFSFLDGGSRIEELVARAAELGQPALALTDHDGLYGAVRFAKACAKQGIKPIFGAEVRVESLLASADPQGTSVVRFDAAASSGAAASPNPGATPDSSVAPPSDPHHLVLLAETREGYANLCRLLSAAHLADPEREQLPLVTLESLGTYAEGLICLTGCRHGEVGYLIDAGREADASRALLRLREIFGLDHLYVELQYFGYEPHQEAYPGQHGSPVFEKIRADGGRLRHRPSASPSSAHADSSVSISPFLPGATTATDSHYSSLRKACTATLVAYRSDLDPPSAVDKTPRSIPAASRPDLPQGHPQRLNPSDYDVGFHRDGRPWRLSCLTYCLRLTTLAQLCHFSTVLTTNAHYASEADRAIHLICRAAGHDQPVSGYPSAVAGVRCLKSKVDIELLAQPLLELNGRDGILSQWTSDNTDMQNYSNATKLAAKGSKQTLSRDVAPACPGPLATPALIAARCNVDLELGTFHFPKVDVPEGETAYSLLAKRCFRGVARRYKPVPPRAVELLEKELRTIQQMGFAHYFLVVHDIVRWARAKGIACSGRGSAGNSIVCHALDITASEPIRHNLLFERFLNPNRREMPDIDVDFCSSRRDEVIEHIYQTFGSENVAVVANVNTMSPRSAVRIVAEALGFAPTEINALAKHVPRHGDAARIREYLAGAWPELRDSPLQDGAHAVAPRDGVPGQPEGHYARFLDLVERLDSFPMHLGTHLGGFVIADRPITYYAPLQWAAKGIAVTQFNKDGVAALGLVKMDILGLRTHSAISECVHLIRQRTGRRIRPYELPPDDPAAYEIISNGGSIGLFQLESAGQRNLASRLQERDFDDIIAAIALYRPGPLEAEMIGPFIDRRWGLEPVRLPHPAMAEAVADTYGVILYQEQVLRIAQSVAGFDLADADSLRRAMTRDRSREEMAKIGETFISRAIARGMPEEAAREVFRQLEGFAAYGFNKSHSVCFAVISYATAYLKAYYPAEFLCAVLNNYPMGFYTPRTVLNDARRFGLEVRPLDINLSGRGFTVENVVAPDVWGDPFAQAWTAEHDWGLTEADLAELREEQEGDLAYAEALRAARTQVDDPHPAANPHVPATDARSSKANSDPSGPDSAANLPASPAPGDEPPLADAPRGRGGVEPGTSLAPSCGIAPDAGQALRVGLGYLKQMGDRSLDLIEEERRHGPFTSFEDFYLRTRIDYPVAENLIRVGAFDSLEPDRTELLWRLPLLHDRLEALAGSSGQRRGQLRAFFSPPSRAGLERQWSLEDKVRSELELLGLTVSCHPLKLYEEELRQMGVTLSYELPGLGDEVPVTVAGVYERAQNPWMRSGKRTMFLTLEDAYGLFECVCFESKLPKIAPVVARASYFLVRGRLQNNHKRGLAIVAEEVFDLEEVIARRRAHRAREVAVTVPGAGTTAIPKKVG
jgi:DNA polymerase III alpha subunit